MVNDDREQAGPPPLNICVGVASFSPWLRSGAATLETFALACQRLGFTAIEPCDRSIRSTAPVFLAELRRFLDREGLTVPCVDVRNDFTVTDSGEWHANIRHVETWMRVANELSVPLIRIWAGVRCVDGSATDRVRRALEMLVPVAERCSVRLALENHGGISSNPRIVVELVRRIGSSQLGTCPDFGHLTPDVRYEGLAMLIPLSLHVHAKAHGFRENGEELQIEYGRIIPLIFRHAQAVFTSIEYEGPAARIEESLAGIAGTRRLIERHWPA